MVTAATSCGAREVEVPGEEVGLDIDGVTVRLWRVMALERFVDTAGLLQADAPPEPPYWMHLWPGALAAARLVAGAAEVGPGVRVLELGCGLALPALVAARRGAFALASDWQRAPLAFARRSALANACELGVLQMDWSAPAVRGGFQVCVGADVGYDAAAEPALVAALTALVAPRGLVWLADSVNTARQSLAERLIVAGFSVTVRETREWEDGRPVWVRVIEARRQ